MLITLNGQDARTGASTLGELLAELKTSTSGVAVALNGKVVRKAELDSTPVAEADNIEVIRAVQGG